MTNQMPDKEIKLCRDCKWAEATERPAPYGASWERWHKLLGSPQNWRPPPLWVCQHPSSKRENFQSATLALKLKLNLVTGEPLLTEEIFLMCRDARAAADPPLLATAGYTGKTSKLCGETGKHWEPRIYPQKSA